MGTKSSLSSSTKSLPSWKFALLPYVTHPEHFILTGDVFHYTSNYVIVKDKYPKSKYHYLILPRIIPTHVNQEVTTSTKCNSAPSPPSATSYFSSYLDLQGNHFDVYDQLITNAVQFLIECLLGKDPNLKTTGFLQGFHACPSLYPLHYHVLSKDFLGSGLKKKHHWNSFTTPFLIPLHYLRRHSHAFPNPTQLHRTYMSIPLRCPWCSSSLSSSSNMIPFLDSSNTTTTMTSSSLVIGDNSNPIETQSYLGSSCTLSLNENESNKRNPQFKSMSELITHLKTQEHRSNLKL